MGKHDQGQTGELEEEHSSLDGEEEIAMHLDHWSRSNRPFPSTKMLLVHQDPTKELVQVASRVGIRECGGTRRCVTWPPVTEEESVSSIARARKTKKIIINIDARSAGPPSFSFALQTPKPKELQQLRALSASKCHWHRLFCEMTLPIICLSACVMPSCSKGPLCFTFSIVRDVRAVPRAVVLTFSIARDLAMA